MYGVLDPMPAESYRTGRGWLSLPAAWGWDHGGNIDVNLPPMDLKQEMAQRSVVYVTLYLAISWYGALVGDAFSRRKYTPSQNLVILHHNKSELK